MCCTQLKIPDKLQKSNTDADIIPREVACVTAPSIDSSYSQKLILDANEEYKDSLEINAANNGLIRIGDGIEGELFDTVEQDSLENLKIDLTKTSDGVPQFYPFARIGTNWSNESAAQNSTSDFSSSTNQNIDTEVSNNTNELTLETNNNIATNQTVDDSRDLPGN